MAKANKKSLDAKAYINGQVNKFREDRRKTIDDVAKKQLVENFRETTSSEEYQEQLDIVHEDADVIRKETREKRWRDITSEEFEDAKTEFYGKDMSLDFWDDFEKLDLWKKVDYLFERFWDTDYAADLMIKLLKTLMPEHDGKWGWLYLQEIINELVGWVENGVYYNKQIYSWLSEKFWDGIITARIYFHLADHVIWGGGYDNWLKNIPYNYKNMTQSTLKRLLTTYWFKTYVLKFIPYSYPRNYAINNLIRACKDWSISDLWLIRELKDIITMNEIDKLSPEWKEYYKQLNKKVEI